MTRSTHWSYYRWNHQRRTTFQYPGRQSCHGGNYPHTFFPKCAKTEPLLRRIIENTADSMGAKATLTFEYFPAPIINDHEDLGPIARNAIPKCTVQTPWSHLPKMMISEDFAYYMEKVPGVFGLVGSQNSDLRSHRQKSQRSLHSRRIRSQTRSGYVCTIRVWFSGRNVRIIQECLGILVGDK